MTIDDHILKSAKPIKSHLDDVAVDNFAVAMKEKLAIARTKGRSGWEECDPAHLSAMLYEHVAKGDPRDVANFCMFLWSLGQPITPCHKASAVAQEPVACVLAEVAKATAKFPTWPTDPLHALAVLGEEFGELTQAVLQSTYEPYKSTPDDVKTEAIQTAAMALRFLMSLNRYQFQCGEQHQGTISGAEDTNSRLIRPESMFVAMDEAVKRGA